MLQVYPFIIVQKSSTNWDVIRATHHKLSGKWSNVSDPPRIRSCLLKVITTPNHIHHNILCKKEGISIHFLSTYAWGIRETSFSLLRRRWSTINESTSAAEDSTEYTIHTEIKQTGCMRPGLHQIIRDVKGRKIWNRSGRWGGGGVLLSKQTPG